jgi:hypothetical protein
MPPPKGERAAEIAAITRLRLVAKVSGRAR